MRFSIIVPIYKIEKYLRQCIDSILAQDYTDFELLLIDDGSPDKCPSICDEYANADSRVKVVHKENGGLVSARKAGADIAQGEYILNIDGDDWIEQGYLSEIEKAIQKSEGADLVAWGYTEKSESREKHFSHSLPEGLYPKERLKEIQGVYLYDKRVKGCVCDSFIISIWTKAVKRELYTACQFCVDNRIDKGEDAILLLNLLYKCNSVYITQYYGYNYRIVSTSMMREAKAKDYKILRLLIEEMRRLIPAENENQIRCYCFHRLMDLFVVTARSLPYKLFKKFIDENLDRELLSYALHGKIYKKRVHERIKRLLLKMRAWHTLYVILKNY